MGAGVGGVGVGGWGQGVGAGCVRVGSVELGCVGCGGARACDCCAPRQRASSTPQKRLPRKKEAPQKKEAPKKRLCTYIYIYIYRTCELLPCECDLTISHRHRGDERLLPLRRRLGRRRAATLRRLRSARIRCRLALSLGRAVRERAHLSLEARDARVRVCGCALVCGLGVGEGRLTCRDRLAQLTKHQLVARDLKD